MKLWPTLGVAFLLIAAWGTSMRLSWSLGRENARNQDGAARREQLRNDIAKDECAHALPDARFTDRLRRHAERATVSAVSPAYTADADHTGNASPLP